MLLPRQPIADRDNYDAKVNWNRTASHQIWAKFSMMHANVIDRFYFGVDGVGGGDTNTRIFTAGQTWTLSPTLVFDANAGVNGMQQNFQGPDYLHQLRQRGVGHSRYQRGRSRWPGISRSQPVQRDAGNPQRTVDLGQH